MRKPICRGSDKPAFSGTNTGEQIEQFIIAVIRRYLTLLPIWTGFAVSDHAEEAGWLPAVVGSLGLMEIGIYSFPNVEEDIDGRFVL